MSQKQIIALVAPLVLLAVMVSVFQALAKAFGERWRSAWYLGLVTYWLTWCTLLLLWMVARENLLALVPLVLASLYKLVPGMEYQKPTIWIWLLTLSTNPGNGFFEELLWRGVYMELFPNSILFQIVWPSVWFRLWYCAPGAIAPDGNPLGLMIGSGTLGRLIMIL